MNMVHWVVKSEIRADSVAFDRARILFNWTLLQLGGALLPGLRWLGCNTGALVSEGVCSAIANECSVLEREKTRKKLSRAISVNVQKIIAVIVWLNSKWFSHIFENNNLLLL